MNLLKKQIIPWIVCIVIVFISAVLNFRLGLLFNKIIFIEGYNDIIEFSSYINSFTMFISTFINWTITSYLLYIFIPTVDDIDISKQETFLISGIMLSIYIIYSLITISILYIIINKYPDLKNNMLKDLSEYKTIKLLSAVTTLFYYSSLVVYFSKTKHITIKGIIKLSTVFILIVVFTIFILPNLPALLHII